MDYFQTFDLGQGEPTFTSIPSLFLSKIYEELKFFWEMLNLDSNTLIVSLWPLVWPVPLAQVLPRPQLIFPSKTWFLEFIWIFSSKNHLKINISHIFWIQISPNKFHWNPAHQDLSNNIKGTFQFLQNFQLRFNLTFSEEIIQYSRTFALQVQMSWNQSSRCTPPRWKLSKDTKNTIWSIWFSRSHNYKTNYLPS